ncbi:hypothetical protein SD70_24225 [Gordoniibacillus kamchatkensis]|uniref:HTH deoR-type domain-containing protein n=1 Tax=Gordoniibacillus kamchatkensis TaxID=1590651 RepID=A0ABR5ADM2_9BACL|nr:DeoR/GlpR family DNA-binding transcription regulator [Paenibacillus sp. VKM B-2647]KIL38793.1 hypothetical protein SD70_24225 [Paenibacillus sp. VKM B-2647]
MSLIGEQRKRTILDLLHAKGNVTSSALVRQLGVSKETVRKYLDELEQEGLLRKVYGGAIALSASRDEPPYLERMTLHRDEKNKIGRRAATLVQDGDVLFLDEGTTLMAMIPYLVQRGLTILTNFFPSASLLIERLHQGRFDGRVIFLGGEIQAEHARTAGSMTEEWLDRHYVDKAFISVDGLHADAGLTSIDAGKAGVSRKAVMHAAEAIAVADFSKLGLRYPYKIHDLTGISRIVCDQCPPKEWSGTLKRRDIVWEAADN